MHNKLQIVLVSTFTFINTAAVHAELFRTVASDGSAVLTTTLKDLDLGKMNTRINDTRDD